MVQESDEVKGKRTYSGTNTLTGQKEHCQGAI